MKRLDLIGQTFGLLTVTGRGTYKPTSHGSTWICVCQCGNKTEVLAGPLKSGTTSSCGCIRKASIASVNLSHGHSRTPEYKIWKSIKLRCLNPNHKAYHNYGGRGVTICDKWKSSFEAFISDVGWRPSENHSIDRINNDGNYEPLNCKWSTAKEQANNTRRNRLVCFNGEIKNIKQWSDHLGINRVTIAKRLKDGWSIKDALTKNVSRAAI